MKTIIFLIILTLLAFLIAKTFPVGVEASLPPHSPSLPDPSTPPTPRLLRPKKVNIYQYFPISLY